MGRTQTRKNTHLIHLFTLNCLFSETVEVAAAVRKANSNHSTVTPLSLHRNSLKYNEYAAHQSDSVINAVS